MTVDTDRLEIFPLNGEQLELLTKDIAAFEQHMGIIYSGEPMEGEIFRIFNGQIDKVKNSGEDYVWHTFWMFRHKKENKIIGSMCFKYAPDEKGEVELGYGINKEYENKGYTTEAIKAMCKWAFKMSKLKKIIAETDKDNIKSQKVLIKCGLEKYKETEESYWWHSSNI